MYFLVPKKMVGFKPIFNLSIMNQYITQQIYNMLTIRQLVELVQTVIWFTTINLQDAYFMSRWHQNVVTSLHIQQVCGHSAATAA